MIDRTLARYPIQQRALGQIPSGSQGDGWAASALAEITEVRAKLDATIERLG